MMQKENSYPTNRYQPALDCLNNWNKLLGYLKSPRQRGGSEKISEATSHASHGVSVISWVWLRAYE